MTNEKSRPEGRPSRIIEIVDRDAPEPINTTDSTPPHGVSVSRDVPAGDRTGRDPLVVEYRTRSFGCLHCTPTVTVETRRRGRLDMPVHVVTHQAGCPLARSAPNRAARRAMKKGARR
ncbi:hypothetical protein [Rhodococcus pyridinivorans]|uniref:Uncharacterized protein n=1 Tax=Rhodococcus pyridinivorans TaxID=103816 RepID=A0A7M2XRR8_9NOCA|nr:hypothetical protein [Rhodococcus pyridinivorans]QOW00486.1 hypothetical protein INP59_09280 [Rhodococcus pyridinivorans]